MESGELAAFSALNVFVEDKNIDLRGISRIFLEHHNAFVSELDRSIPSHNYRKIFNWERSPFEVSALEVLSEIDCIAEQLKELQSRQMWRDKFKIVFQIQFWANVGSKEPNLSDLCKQATIALLPFSTTCLCASGFSTLAMAKTKYRNQLQPEGDIRCALTTIVPDFDKLVK